MSPRIAFVVALSVLSLLFARAAGAVPLDAPDPAFEARMQRELTAVAPELVPTWDLASQARAARDYAKAATLYAAILARAPGFAPAQRRECTALSAIGKRDEALRWCRSAVAADDSAENEGALASALLTTSPGASATSAAADRDEAKSLATRASGKNPDDPYAWVALFHAAALTSDLPTMRRASGELLRLSPDSAETNWFAAMVAASDGDAARARSLLERARAEGLPRAAYDDLASAIDKEAAGPWWLRAAKGLGVAVVVWGLVLAALLIAGALLSRATLRAVAARPTEAEVRPGELRLRKAYRAVLWCAGAYYYASLPLLAVAVLAATVGIIFAIVAIGFVAIKLFIVLVIVAFGSLLAIVRSVFVRVRDEDPGVALDLAANPRMRAVLDEVAARVGTAPVDRVFMTPFTEVAVFDRGSLGAQLRGSGGNRCLILGAGVLDGMRVRALKSVLAHEYGHFRNEDTAGGGFALSVRRSLGAMTRELVVRRVASKLNVAWWFVRGFSRAFLGVSQGASRLQEVLADRAAAFAYGSAPFEEGLRHVIARTVRFQAHVNVTLGEVIKARAPLPNLYAFVPEQPAPDNEVDKAIAQAIGRDPTPYDSHPRPEDRLSWVRALDCAGEPGAPDDAEGAWSLFADRGAIEASMTAEVRTRLAANKGIVLRAH